MKHRSECPSVDAKWKRAEAPLYGLLCICDRLEECEQRVLDAARAAVDSISPIDQLVYEGFISLVYDKGEILAAIDELRKRP
jgi:hypothetical protein